MRWKKPSFRDYDNAEMYVPSPEMVRRFIHRIRSIKVKGSMLIAVETGACESEVWRLRWKGVNLTNKTIRIIGVKGHRAFTYQISDELALLLSRIPRRGERIFRVKSPVNIGKNIRQYRRILFNETGNPDYLKIHFHTLRHFAISWFYFKTRDIVATQRFARHYNIQNTLRYVHIVKA